MRAFCRSWGRTPPVARSLARERLCRGLAQTVLVAAAMLLFAGCATPDRWYDLDERYQDSPALRDVPPVDPETFPAPEWATAPGLPEIQGEQVSLSLEEAVLLTLRHNRELQVERFNPVMDGAFEQVERGVFDPELFADLTYAEETASEISRSTEDRFDVEGEDAEAEAGVRQRLPTGTLVESSLTYRRALSDRTPEQQETRLGLTLTQSLLEGFGPAVNLVDIRLAQLETQVSLYELRGFMEALVAETETAYWRYVLAGEQVTIFERSLDIAQQQLDEVEQRIEVGDLPRNAAAAARAEVARRDQALIEARSTYEDRRLRLLRLLNASRGETFALDVIASSPPRTAAAALTDLEDRLELARQMRPDLNEARLRHDQRRLEVIRTRNGLLPRLDLFIDLGKTGYAETFRDAFSNLDSDTYDLAAGVRFSTYFGDRDAKARDLVARASREQAEAALANLANLVLLDVRLALNETERTRRQIEAGAVTRALQEQTLKAEQERFSVGTSTPLLVAQAQRDLLVSQLAEIGAIVEYRIALVDLFLAEGSLLERRGIRLIGTEE